MIPYNHQEDPSQQKVDWDWTKKEKGKYELEENKMENDLEIGIGTKEVKPLEPKNVAIQSVELEEIKKNGKVVGKKVICVCIHPDKQEAIAISSARFVRNNQITSTGLWLNKDEDNLIIKGSALAMLMTKMEVSTPKELEGKEAETELDARGYLTLKAY